MMTNKKSHIPVLLKEVIEALAPKDGEIFVDGTFGGGGYSVAILNAANCKVYAIDFLAPRALITIFASSVVVFTGASARAFTINLAMRREACSSPKL